MEAEEVVSQTVQMNVIAREGSPQLVFLQEGELVVRSQELEELKAKLSDAQAVSDSWRAACSRVRNELAVMEWERDFWRVLQMKSDEELFFYERTFGRRA